MSVADVASFCRWRRQSNQSVPPVFDPFSREKSEGRRHQRAVFTALVWKNTTLAREFYKTRSKQRRRNSAEAAAPPPTPPSSNTPEVTTKNRVSGFSFRDLNTQNKSAQLLLCEAAANGFFFFSGRKRRHIKYE